MRRGEREKVYYKKRQEVLDLLNVIKYRAISPRYFDGDLEKEINRLTFLAVKLRQIEEHTKGGDQI